MPVRAVACAAALSLGLCVAGTAASGAAPGAELWFQRYSDPAAQGAMAHALVVSPDGTTVFVAGDTYRQSKGTDYMTTAYTAATGAPRWTRYFNGAGDSGDYATSVAVSPDGARAFVTGSADFSSSSEPDFGTVAYNATTGARLWSKRYDGSAKADVATAVAVSPDNSKVFVTGESWVAGSTDDYATIAYDAATGARLWTRRYDGPAHSFDSPVAIARSPDGSAVYVTGSSYSPSDANDFATVAYQASTGKRLWVTRYDGPGSKMDKAAAVAVSLDGARVIVTGSSFGGGDTQEDYATIAYAAADGSQQWIKRYDGAAHQSDTPAALAVSPDGQRVFVTGFGYEIPGNTYSTDASTIAYDPLTGNQLWIAHYHGPAFYGSTGTRLAVSSDGTKLVVAGQTTDGLTGSDYLTLSYDAPTGTERWVATYAGPGRYDQPGLGEDRPTGIGLSPGGSTAYVTGWSMEPTGLPDWVTIAYDNG